MVDGYAILSIIHASLTHRDVARHCQSGAPAPSPPHPLFWAETKHGKVRTAESWKCFLCKAPFTIRDIWEHDPVPAV